MQPGGFLQGSHVVADGHLFTIQTVTADSRLIRLGKRVEYL